MNQHEHTQEATELVRRAHEESTNGGNERIAAELLWGAFAHCLIAVAQNEELPHDSHGAFRTIARHMDAGRLWRPWKGWTAGCRCGMKGASSLPRRRPQLQHFLVGNGSRFQN